MHGVDKRTTGRTYPNGVKLKLKTRTNDGLHPRAWTKSRDSSARVFGLTFKYPERVDLKSLPTRTFGEYFGMAD